MKKIFVPLILMMFVILNSSCKEGWTSEYKEMYLDGCKTSGNALQLDSTNRVEYCNCSLEKVMKQYPDIEAAMINKDSTQMSAALKACMEKAKY